MSDFDREAEREKLREKFERDKRKREASEQMSELLLQGATMTNRHCPECHSPVFRYDGQEFCPTCQREVTEDGEFVGEDGETAGAATDGRDADNRDGDAAETEATGEAATPDRQASAPADHADEPQREAGNEEDRAETRPAPARESRPARVDPPARTEQPSASGGDLGEAEAALVREITSLSRKAEDTSDVGRKRDLFAAAREAAETLQTIRRL